MVRFLILLEILFITFSSTISAQKKQPGDNTNKIWPAGFETVEIKSSSDGAIQKAWFYKSSAEHPQPLIVSLHTWSGDYNQEDPLVKEILLRDWNYIHPDFRGVNNNPKACGSDLVISDIEDAIHYAIKRGNVDSTNVHIIGVSGGGYASLLAFMKLKYPVKSFNAWASISSLADWYMECKSRGLKYATDLELVTTKGNGFDKEEALRRSPVFMEYNSKLRKGSSLFIYTGINDGYTGSVPISQSINMYNRLLTDMYPKRGNESVPDSIKNSLLARRISPDTDNNIILGGRKIHLLRRLPNLSLTVFDGTHEMIVPQALALIPTNDKPDEKYRSLNILTIGDSNGAGPDGWPEQLKKLEPYSTVVNRSVSGNTIGFDNLGQSSLNTLKNIERYLEEAYKQIGSGHEFDFILMNLGTNDTKVIFKDQQKEVAANLALLIQKIKEYIKRENRKLPQIIIITPSPMDEEKIAKEKYGGGDERIRKNNILFKQVAVKNHVGFIDTYPVLKKDFSLKTTDGVHLIPKAQFQMATMIADFLNKKY
jgi:lysophospholipase L1-like esterase